MQRLRPMTVVGSIAAVVAALPVLAAVAMAADPVLVRPGDTLTSIARRSGVSIEQIVQLNRLADPNRIYVGQKLRLEETPTVEAAPTSDGEIVHVVRRGETTWGIAMHYGVTVSAMAAANQMTNPGRIFAGTRLVIPGNAAPTPAPSAASAQPAPSSGGEIVHVVRRGETTWGIAMHYGVSVAAVADTNALTNPGRIFAGMRLVIPGGTPAPRGPRPESSATLPADMAAAVAKRDEVRRLIVAEAERFEVPVALALAVAWQESGWRQNVVSHAGAVGVMQLLPSTAEWVASSLLREPVDVRDVRDNVRGGVRLLAHYLARYDGSVDLALAAYYQGQTGTDRHGVYPVTRAYVDAIRGLQRLFGG